MKQFIIVHETQGVYLGSCIGLGFWSELDPAGQTSACTFMAESQARNHVATWDAPHGDPDNYRYVEVEIEKDRYATMEECMDAGQKPWPLLEESCQCGAPKAEWRRLCTQYHKESQNWIWSCESCYKETDGHYQDLWHEIRY